MFNKKWQQKKYDKIIDWQTNNHNLCEITRCLLANRNIVEQNEIELFLQPSLNQIKNPYLFADLEKASLRIIQAVKNKEVIGIFGDYDVDGVCSTALLVDFLRSINANVCATLPNRLTEGYGLSAKGIDRLAKQKASLIITTDCGSQAFDEVEYARSLGIEVIVIDHHNVLDSLPKALAIVNPKRKDCLANASILCATGVAFYVVLGVRKLLYESGICTKKPSVVNLLDLVALATVCDVVPLIEDNRVFVNYGLQIIKQGQREGLKALLEVSGVDKNRISSTNLGFHLGPRINAAGRLDDACIALELMNNVYEEAFDKAQILHEHNQERQSLEEQILLEACLEIDENNIHKDKKILVLYNEKWHHGVVGIVASRLAEKYHKPAIVIGESKKGSGRSIKGIDLHAMVSLTKEHLNAFGGHFHAIGLSLKSLVDEFRNALDSVIKSHIDDKIFEPIVFYEQEINLSVIDHKLIKKIKLFEPFGASNPYPVFRINNCFMKNIKQLNGGHLKGEIFQDNNTISFIAFRTPMMDIMLNKSLDILAILEENTWQNQTTIQMRIVDYKLSLNQ